MDSDPRRRNLTLRERWQRYWYLQHVALWLDPMPRKRRKPVLRELKANLGAAAADAGMPAAIGDLGRPRALARQYLQTEPQGRPTWHHGAFAASGALVLWVLMLAVYLFGSLNTLLATGLNEPANISFLGLSITTEAHGTFTGANFTGIPWPGLIALVVIFLLFSRVWRLLRPAQHQATNDHVGSPT